MKNLSIWLSLFTSGGTLFCCALPSLLVVMGMGATMAGLVTAVPQIVWLSQYKIWVFLGSALMLILAGFMQYQAHNQPCPVDPIEAKVCMSGRRWAMRIYILSLSLWLIGAFFAFLAPILF